MLNYKDAAEIYQSAMAQFWNGEFAEANETAKSLTSIYKNPKSIEIGPKFGQPKTAIVIVAHRSLSDHQALVSKISDLHKKKEIGFIFVSNGPEELFGFADEFLKGNWTKIVTGHNFGACMARNFAIDNFDGDEIIFVDDDGLTEIECIESLIQTKRNFGAVCVRGKVIPKTRTSSGAPPKHYDLGNSICVRYPDIEGMAIWSMAALRLFQFNPLLPGHEGAEIASRMYRYYGYEAFLYDPNAVLHHDYVKLNYSDQTAEAKRTRMKLGTDYIRFINPDYENFLAVMRGLGASLEVTRILNFRRRFIEQAPKASIDAPLVFITTCRNGEEFIPDYILSLHSQTDQKFRVIFIDDGSEDDTWQIIQSIAKDDSRFTTIQVKAAGRASALALAIDNVKVGEIAMIADVDDISVAQRVEWTRKAFALQPSFTAIGFNIFDKSLNVRSARPYVYAPTPIEFRAYTGMPSPFPGFSFKKTKNILAINKELVGGIDCDWVLRNIFEGVFFGEVLPLGVSFYRTHKNQISASKREIQRRVAIDSTRRFHERLLGRTLTQDELIEQELFVGWRTIANMNDLKKLEAYACKIAINDPPHQEHVKANFGAFISLSVDTKRYDWFISAMARGQKVANGARVDNSLKARSLLVTGRFARRYVPTRFHPQLKRIKDMIS